MIVMTLGFIRKTVSEALTKVGFDPKSFDIEYSSTDRDLISFVMGGKTMFLLKVQYSLVDETPATVWLSALAIPASTLIEVARIAGEIMGDRAKIILN